MMLSKLQTIPLSRCNLRLLYRNTTFSYLPSSRQHSQLACIIVPINLKLVPQNVTMNKRHFKPANKFHPEKDKLKDFALGFRVFLVVATFAYFAFDFEFILKKFTEGNLWKTIKSINFKKADSLAKDEIDRVDSPNQSQVVQEGLLSNVLYYFNVKRDQDSKAGGFRDKKVF